MLSFEGTHKEARVTIEVAVELVLPMWYCFCVHSKQTQYGITESCTRFQLSTQASQLEAGEYFLHEAPKRAVHKTMKVNPKLQ